MKPIYQTIFEPPYSNCLQACIASILELDLESVPNFVEVDDWLQALDDFLDGYGLYALRVDAADWWKPKGYHIIAGPSPRFSGWHAMVGKDGIPAHDPYPGSGNFRFGGIERKWTLLVTKCTFGRKDP